MVGNEEMDAMNEHVRKSAAVSVVSLRAESLSADGDNIVTFTTHKVFHG
jgi:hypothetical protein